MPKGRGLGGRCPGRETRPFVGGPLRLLAQHEGQTSRLLGGGQLRWRDPWAWGPRLSAGRVLRP